MLNEQIRAIANEIQKEYGLEHYVLKRWPIFSETTMDNMTNYILTLEWFPADKADEEHDDINPDGSAVIDINLHTKKVRSIIFVHDISYASEGIFPSADIEEVIEWIEGMTGVMFGRQFKLVKESDKEFNFRATVDNMEVNPTGHIYVTFNDKEQLTNFSINGVFPTEDDVEWEPFSLTKEDLLTEIKEQLSMSETPIEKEEKWVNLWHLNPFYVRNDKSKLLLPENINRLHTYKEFNIPLVWDVPSNKNITLQDIDFSHEVSYEEAMAKVEMKPITDEEQSRCIQKTEDFLSNHYPKDSGAWAITGMYPEKNYIMVDLKGRSFKAFQRKLKIIINRNDLHIANYWDNNVLLDMFNSFQESGERILNKEAVFEKIIRSINVTPVYVKEPGSDFYHLYARVDCDVVVDDATGDFTPISKF